MEFFTASTRNIVAAAKTAGLGHYVALSVVGADRLADSGYMRAKVAQEGLIKASGLPYTILRATQFFEFVGAIADSGMRDNAIHMPSALIQPIAADDVAAALTEIAVAAPANSTVDLAGPHALPMDELIRNYLKVKGDPRQVVVDDSAGYYGAKLARADLVPAGKCRIGATTLQQWLART
jgi:uncharacterized protein YbjT (DUF2867 family)